MQNDDACRCGSILLQPWTRLAATFASILWIELIRGATKYDSTLSGPSESATGSAVGKEAYDSMKEAIKPSPNSPLTFGMLDVKWQIPKQRCVLPTTS